jgi:hypothetical protein
MVTAFELLQVLSNFWEFEGNSEKFFTECSKRLKAAGRIECSRAICGS